MVRTPGQVAPSSQEMRAETFSRPVLELELVKISFLASAEPCAAAGNIRAMAPLLAGSGSSVSCVTGP